MGFSTFEMDQSRKIHQHHWIERLKIHKIAKFQSDLLKTNENTAPQSCKILQTFVWCGAQTGPPPYKRL